MEYSLNQNVVFFGEDMMRGKRSDEEYARVYGVKFTGKIIGHFDDHFIVKLDQALPDGETAVLVHSDSCKPLNCHWCQDRKLTPVGSFTKGQADANAIPTEACPYC